MYCYLQGLSSYCGNINLGGLRCIEYIPTPWVNAVLYEQLISGGYNWQKAITLVDGANWLKAYLVPSPRNLRERQRTNKQGPFMEQTVQGVLPGYNASIAGELNAMKQYRYILRLTTREDNVFLVGSLEYPCNFSAALDTGSKASDLKAHSITWTSQVPEKAFGYVPII